MANYLQRFLLENLDIRGAVVHLDSLGTNDIEPELSIGRDTTTGRDECYDVIDE